MWYNVKTMNRGLIMSERVMLALGETMGRQVAHSVVYTAAMQAYKEKLFLNQTLWADERVRNALGSEAKLEQLLDPSGYTGQSSAFACSMSAQALKVAKELWGMASQLKECAGLQVGTRAPVSAGQ